MLRKMQAGLPTLVQEDSADVIVKSSLGVRLTTKLDQYKEVTKQEKHINFAASPCGDSWVCAWVGGCAGGCVWKNNLLCPFRFPPSYRGDTDVWIDFFSGGHSKARP